MKTYSYISLFSGCGGVDVGFEQNDFNCLSAFDNNPYAINVFNNNLKGRAHNQNLSDEQFLKGLTFTPDVVIAGSPCQGFSTIGKRQLDDPRNELLLTGGKLAIKLKAKVFICENVLGSLAGEHRKYWNDLKKLLHEAGYKTKMEIYDTLKLGMCQHRKRVILFAWRSSKLSDFDSNIPALLPVTLGATIKIKNQKKVLNHNLDYIDRKSDDFKIAQTIKPGQKLCNVRGGVRAVHTWHIPEVFGVITDDEEIFLCELISLRRKIRQRDNGDADPLDIKLLTKYFGFDLSSVINALLKKGYLIKKDANHIDIKHTFNGKFKRLRLDGYSPTVDTRFGIYKYFLHPTENRGFSVREAARIQGFEDSFVFEGPLNKQYEMIGNAVPPPLSSAIARIVKTKLLPKL